MNRLTGDKNVNFLILMKLTDKELSMVCSVNKYVNELCKDDTFWFNRVLLTFNLEPFVVRDMKSYLQFDNWKEFYFWLQKENFAPGRVNIIAKSLDKKEVIDKIVEIFKMMKLKKWINREEFYKVIRRYAFINAQNEINQEYMAENDFEGIDEIEWKVYHSLADEELVNIFVDDWHDAKDKFEKF